MTTTETIPANVNLTDVPDLTTYYQVHQAMRVANEQIIAGLVDPNLREEDRRRAAAMAKWFAGYCGELRAHHYAEDHLIFPALAERVPVYASYAEMLAADHHRLDEILDGLGGALKDMATYGGPWSTAKDEALDYAIELRDLLLEHLAVEDSDVIPLIERNFGKEEYEVIEKQIIKTISPRQALFTVPWWMATAAPEAAANSLAGAPLSLKIIYYTTRGRYARLVKRAFG